MAISKDKKVEIISKVSEAIKEAGSMVFVKFDTLTVANAMEMRRALRASGIKYFVAKKTLIKKALKDFGVTGELPVLDGEIALAWSKELTDPAREVFTFQKKFDKKVAIVGGVFENKFMNKEEMLAVALIPSMQGLRGMFVNIVNSPIQRFVIGLGEVAKKKTA